MSDTALISAISRVLARGVELGDMRASAEAAREAGEADAEDRLQEWEDANESLLVGIRDINRMIATTARGVAFKLNLITYALAMHGRFGDDIEDTLGQTLNEAIAAAVVELDAISRQEGGQ